MFPEKPLTTRYPSVKEWTRVEQDFSLDMLGSDTTSYALNLTLRHGGSERSLTWFHDVKLEFLAANGAEQPSGTFRNLIPVRNATIPSSCG